MALGKENFGRENYRAVAPNFAPKSQTDTSTLSPPYLQNGSSSPIPPLVHHLCSGANSLELVPRRRSARGHSLERVPRRRSARGHTLEPVPRRLRLGLGALPRSVVPRSKLSLRHCLHQCMHSSSHPTAKSLRLHTRPNQPRAANSRPPDVHLFNKVSSLPQFFYSPISLFCS